VTGSARLAVHVGRDVPEGLTTVLSAVGPWADAVAAPVQEPLPENTRAHLYTSDVLPRRPAAPHAVWRSPGAEAAEFGDVPVVAEAGTGRPGDLQVCLAPWSDGARPLLPFTRAGYRRLRGLPDQLVASSAAGQVTWGQAGAAAVEAPAHTWPTLAALSSAVVATGDALWTALAWAAPAVTDPATAQRFGLTPGEHVLVGDDDATRHRLAAALAADETRAAGLARRGWQTARSRRPEAVAEELCRRLGLHERGRPHASGLTWALDALGTPLESLVRHRARAATAILPGAVTFGWRPDREEHA